MYIVLRAISLEVPDGSRFPETLVYISREMHFGDVHDLLRFRLIETYEQRLHALDLRTRYLLHPALTIY